MKFSIVTASYNQGRFIRDCIESVKSQAGVEWEHIVQDSCSTDETHAVLREHPHLKVTIEKDAGMSDGINRGFRQATGDWVMWLNTDDYLLPDALTKVAEFIRKNPKADIVYGDSVFVKENKEIIRRKREHEFSANVLLFYGCYIQSTTTFLRRSIISGGHMLDLNYRICMDYEYYMRLHRLGYRYNYLAEEIAAFRWHETNTSSVQFQRRRDERWQVQCRELALSGKSFLKSRRLLDVVFYRAYQVRRAMLRWKAHGLAR
jgi:glycosyltransferase involved in cell wall biosynthesis